MEEQLVSSSEFERYGDFNPEKIADVFDTKPRLVHFEILRDPETNEIAQKIPVYEIDIVNPATFESIALFLKPDIRKVGVVAAFRPFYISINSQSTIESGKIPEGSTLTHKVFFEKRVDRVDIHASPMPVSELTYVNFVSEDDDSLTELVVDRAAQFTFACYSKKDMHPLEIEPLS